MVINILNTVQLYNDEQSAAFALSSSMQTIASVTIDVAPGSRILAIGEFNINVPASATGACQIIQGGTLFGANRTFGSSTSDAWNGNVILFAVHLTPAVGSSVIALQASIVFASTVSAVRRSLVVIVL